MTVEDTVYKTLALFGILLVTAVVGWVWTMAGVDAQNPNPSMAPWLIGALGGFVLAMVNIFKKKPSVPLIIAYAAFEGLFVGGISAFRSEEHTSELQSLMRISYAVFCLKKKKNANQTYNYAVINIPYHLS